MSANAIDRLREGLNDGCDYSCGCETHGEWSKCIHGDRYDALAAVKALLEVTKRALVYWDADDVDSLDSVMLEVEKAIRRVESGQ